MKLLLVESVTAGAFDRLPPPALLPEAEAMLGAMVAEVLLRPDAALPSLQTRVLRDYSLPELQAPLHRVAAGAVAGGWSDRSRVSSIEVVVVPAGGGWSQVWCEALAWADAVWLVAPETGGELASLSRQVEAAGVRLLGCAADAVAVAASKSATHAALAGRVRQPEPALARRFGPSPQVATAGRTTTSRPADQRTRRAVSALSTPGSLWVIKPDDGVAAEGVRRVPARAGGADAADGADAAGEDEVLPAAPPGCIVQPYIDGEPLSLCVLSDGVNAHVLAVNLQRIDWHTDGRAQYRGGVTNAIDDRTRFAHLAHAVQAAMPGLWGCWGVDCVLPADGEPVLIEVNPRLTTAFAHLREATGFDLLGALLELAAGGVPSAAPAGRAVAFELTFSPAEHT